MSVIILAHGGGEGARLIAIQWGNTVSPELEEFKRGRVPRRDAINFPAGQGNCLKIEGNRSGATRDTPKPRTFENRRANFLFRPRKFFVLGWRACKIHRTSSAGFPFSRRMPGRGEGTRVKKKSFRG